jgi:hypothetical protein
MFFVCPLTKTTLLKNAGIPYSVVVAERKRQPRFSDEGTTVYIYIYIYYMLHGL